MQHLPENIEVKFFRLIFGQEPISEFEQWVYATSPLEEILGEEDYLNLISLDFAKQSIRFEVIKILERHIDAGKYETWKLRNLLNRFIDQERELKSTLGEFYNLYCDGFSFLQTLGLGYGLTILDTPSANGAIEEARKVLAWLDQEKIVIINHQDQLGDCLYLDKRDEKEKKQNWQKFLNLSNKHTSWWKFWQ